MKAKEIKTPKEIKALRRELGLTQQQLAARLGTHQVTIARWESGFYEPTQAYRRLLGMVAEQAEPRAKNNRGAK